MLEYKGIGSKSLNLYEIAYKWKIYSSTTTPPTEPGSYVMTVVTLGGNYQAAPITRGFKITK